MLNIGDKEYVDRTILPAQSKRHTVTVSFSLMRYIYVLYHRYEVLYNNETI